MIWNEIYGNSTKFTDNSTLQDIYDLHIPGQAIQLSNGQNKDGMYAFAFNNQSLPYYFNKAGIGSVYGLQKSASASNLNIGRGAAIVKDSITFFFLLKNIKVDNQAIDFTDAPDTAMINNLTDLNKYLVTRSFTINNASDLNYVLNYGVSSHDTALSMTNVLGKSNSINYKLDLVDAVSGNVVGNIETIEFNENSRSEFEEKSYKINTESLEGSKQVRLRITAEDNFNGKCALIESSNDENSDKLAKGNIKEINYKDLAVVKDYGLEQNYPNPFNPATTITYQLPKDGIVTLKVYDMLGREVASLVNGYKTSGKYSINFNADNLSSGVYIYQLKINNFAGGDGYTATKKLMLLK
ncbi:MAG: T9SS type A sorting domain-containing protein [Ignavibacteriaceae bacterium]